MKNQGQIRTFRDAVAIVTGGASGIGRALGETLAEQGCEVVLADLQIDLAEKVADGIRASGGKATAVECDVTNYDVVKNVVMQTVERCGRLDYMFNNAGIVVLGEVIDYEISDWDRSIDINLRGVVHGVDAAYRVMCKQGFGHIVNTASIAGLVPWPMEIAYPTTKHAVVGLSTTLRVDSKHTGVRVSVLCPGAIRTPMVEYGGEYGRWIRNYPRKELEEFMTSIKPMAVDKFAQRALKQVARNKAIIVLPSGYKILWWMNRLSPSLGIAIIRYVSHVMRKKLAQIEIT